MTGVVGGWSRLWTDIASEWRRDRNLVFYLLACAVFRDGLGVFAFGAALGANMYGISKAKVLILGVAAQCGSRTGRGAGSGAPQPDRIEPTADRLAGPHRNRSLSKP